MVTLKNSLRHDTQRQIHAPHGTTLSAKSWLTEAPMRMLMNNLDPNVAENPSDLIVYGGLGRTARDWACFDQISANIFSVTRKKKYYAKTDTSQIPATTLKLV